ncbi:MAG: hypothetical protein AAFN79_04040 [Pseudomonadota bacterium]
MARFFGLSAAVAVALSFHMSAQAGPWTRAVGEGFSSQETRYFRTDGPGDERFEQATVSVFLEYGVAERVTLGVKVEQSTRLDGNGPQSETGRVGGFARIGVWSGKAGDAAAVEAGFSMPLGGFQSSTAPNGDDADEYRISALYGRGFQSDWGDGWVDGAFSLAHLTGGRADEVKLDLTAGLRPDEDWIVMGQMFGTFGLRNEDSIVDPDFDVVKLKASVGYRIFEDKTVLIGVSRDVLTRGTDPGWEVSLTIWTPFTFDFDFSSEERTRPLPPDQSDLQSPSRHRER